MKLWQRENEANDQEFNNNSIEELFGEYIASLQRLSDESKTNPRVKFDSYHALVTAGSLYEPENCEAKRQSTFLEKLRKKNQHEYILGRNSHGHVTFCQVVTKGYELNEDKQSVQKLYINCQRDKITDVVQCILKSCDKQKSNVSMKFIYEDGQSNNYLRNDKIVIYCEDEVKKNQMLDIVNEIAVKQPKLFDSRKTIPFMPKTPQCDFVSSPGKTQRGRYTVYNSTGGNLNRAVVNTYNNILAEALQESFVISTALVLDKFYSEKDERTGEIIATSDRMKKSLKSFYSIDEQQRVDIINTMKTVLPDICMANNINIDSKLSVKEQKMELPLNDFETTVKFYQDIDESKKRDDYVHDIK